MNYQKLILAGNATRDAQRLGVKNGGVTYTTFGVGVSDGKDNRTTVFPFIVFGDYGETVAKYVTKGKEVLIDGRIQVSDKGFFHVIADRVRFGAGPRAADSSR
jgi:single-stranded DNA-binding protein